ncbi:MAG TPA: hypothetical protein VGI10_30005 [Polyangiaceae bacterium]
MVFRAHWVPLMLLAALLPAPAVAQTADKSTAVALFDEAEKLASAGNFAEACPKFAESYRLDPQLGALMHLADCYGKNGQLASAWASFHDAADVATQRGDDRAQLAKQRAAALEGQLSHLSILVPKEVVVPGIDVRRDGTSVGPALWGSAVPVDPGEHHVQVSAPGKVSWQGTVTVGATGDNASLSVPPMVDAGIAPPPSAPPAPQPAASADSSAHALSTQTISGIAAIGLGVVGLGLGTVFELRRSSKLSERDDVCPSGVNCEAGSNARIQSLESDAKSAGTIGAIGLVAGGVFTAAGIALIVTAPSAHASSVAIAPVLGPRFQGFSLSHAF